MKKAFQNKVSAYLQKSEGSPLEQLQREFTALKTAYHSDIAAIEALNSKLREKEEENAKLRRLVAELTANNLALVRQMKESEERLRLQEAEFRKLEEAATIWSESLAQA